ncbi:multi-sensor signal transduction histidine kinase [Rhodopirellula sallentina SM41]|uniref:histidine kinase n=2 Tax=Rhodopirellula TaxID=265488 RepID=M5TSK0_9BACT|nr:multi-sensor signal transduction histidine kinase [Rhodopirellula sallentina SM41]
MSPSDPIKLRSNGYRSSESVRERVKRRAVNALRRRGMAWGILALSLVLTAVIWHQTDRHIERRNQERFAYRIAEIETSIEERMLEYEQVLRDGSAFWHASQHVSRQEWHDYVETGQIHEHFPGIQAFAFAKVIAPNELQTHIDSVRAEGFSEYRVYPQSDRDFYTSIIYIEPFDWRNQRAFGYDMYSEPVRREAMQRAARTGRATISGKITLLQETEEDVQAGVLCYLPVYEKGTEVATPGQREESLKGWVYAAFRIDDLMRGIVGSDVSDISFRIWDAVMDSNPQRIYSSGSDGGDRFAESDKGYCHRSALTVSGRDWIVDFATTPSFFDVDDNNIRAIVVICGLVIDLLLFLFVLSIGNQRESAVELARKMTVDLKESEARTRSILENASDAILSVNADGVVSVANDAAQWMFLPKLAKRGEADLVDVQFGDLISGLSFADMIDVSRAYQSLEHRNDDGIAVRCRRDDGTQFPCRMSIGPFDGGEGYIVIARDETARIAFAKELAETNRQLVKASHKAGMAEVATSVLHDVGNSLTGVSTSSNLIAAMLEDSAVSTLSRAIDVMNEHRDDLSDYLQNDKQGKRLPDFLTQIASTLDREKQRLEEENRHLGDHVGHIDRIIRAQQDQASSSIVLTREFAAELMEQAALVNLGRHSEFEIAIERDLDSSATIVTDRNKVLQILINFVANAQDAVREIDDVPRQVHLSTRIRGDYVEFAVTDNGPGIAKDVLPKLKQFGFTTKNDGHGFGLHSCDLTAKALQGRLEIENNESGRGACFRLVLPLVLSREIEFEKVCAIQLEEDADSPFDDAHASENLAEM